MQGLNYQILLGKNWVSYFKFRIDADKLQVFMEIGSATLRVPIKRTDMVIKKEATMDPIHV